MPFSNRIYPLVGLVCLVLAYFVPSPPLLGLTTSLSPAQLTHFVETNLPARIGRVTGVGSSSATVSKPFEVQVNQETRVRIFRRRTDPSSDTVRRQQIGQGRFIPVTQTRGRLEAPASVLNRVQPDDEIWLPPVHIYLKNSTTLNSSELSGQLREIPSVGKVSPRVPAEFPDSPRLQIVLEVNNRGAFLRKAGDWGAFATLTPSRSTDPEMRETSADRTQAGGGAYTLQETFELSGDILSFDWLQLGEDKSVNIIAMAGGTRIGFARWDGQLDGLTWHEISYGRALDVSLLPKKMKSHRRLPLLVVSHQQEDVVTSYYEYDLIDRTLTRRWSERHHWMRATGEGVLGQEVGLAMPYERRVWPVDVDRNGWDWESTRTGDSPFPHATVLWGLQVFDGRYFRFNQEHRFEIWRGNSRLAKTGSAYGRTRFSVHARDRHEYERIMHPRVAVWKHGRGYRMVVPQNQRAGSMSFFTGLTLNKGQVVLFDLQGSSLRSVWKSRTLAGYVTAAGRGPEAPWISVALQENDRTRFFRLEGTGFSDNS